MSARRGGPTPGPVRLTGTLLLAGAIFIAAPTPEAAGQDLPHPRQMELPEADTRRPDPATHRLRLENGLVAYVAEDRTVPLVTVRAVVRAGTAQGPPGAVAALARAFRRGPADLTRGHFREQLADMAADFTVSVDPELLELSLDAPAADAPAAVDLLARTLRNPLVAPADVEAVAAASGSAEADDEASLDGAVRLFRGHLYGDHPYGPAGARNADGTLTTAAVNDAHRRRVGPSNTVVSVGGAVEPDRARRWIRESFRGWEAGSVEDPASPPALSAPGERAVHLYPADKLQGWIVLGHELPPVPEEDAAALEVMNYILGGGHFDTRLFRATRDRRGITNDASGFPVARAEGPGTYTFRTYGRPEVVKLLVELTFREIERIRSEPVSEEELFVARGALADGVFAERYRDGWATASSLARERALRGHHRRSESYRERIRAVTADDVLRVARAYLHPNRMQIVVVGPLDEIRAAPPLEDERSLDAWGPVHEARDPAGAEPR